MIWYLVWKFSALDRVSVRYIEFPCRVGELTFWSPRRRLWVYRAALDEATPEDGLIERFRENEEAVQGALLYGIPVSSKSRRIRWYGGLLRYMPQHGKRHFIPLGGRFDDYMATFSSKTRSTLRRKMRRFERESGGKLDFREYRGSAGLLEFYVLAREVSALSYQEVMLASGLPDSTEFRDELARVGAQDEARGYVLMLKGQPVAYIYCPVADGVARYEFVGYKPEAASLSPGTVLLLKALERLFEDPEARIFDFTEGGGEDSHKAFFATESRNCGNVYLLRPGLGNLLIIGSQIITDALSHSVGLVLKRIGLKKRVRKMVRKIGVESR